MALTVRRGQSACWVLSPEPEQVGRAREEARKALFGWGLGEHADLCELIVSELVTNAIRHGEGPVRVRISHTDDRLRVAVHDHSPARPARRRADADEESGRGLELVDGLAGLHGGRRGTISDRTGRGKTVYVVIRLAVALSSNRGGAAPGGHRGRLPRHVRLAGRLLGRSYHRHDAGHAVTASASLVRLRVGGGFDQYSAGQPPVGPGPVFGELGHDGVLQVRADHLGQAEQEDRRVGKLFRHVRPALAPGVERLGYLAVEQAEL